MPIHGLTLTRLVALFADKHPENAGPVRSGRVLHAELRENGMQGGRLLASSARMAPMSTMRCASLGLVKRRMT